MRFAAVKTKEQQSLMILHRTRSLLVRQPAFAEAEPRLRAGRRTMVVNAIRAHLAELGIVAPVGLRGMKALLAVIADPKDQRLPPLGRTCLASQGRPKLNVEEATHLAG